MCLVVLLTVVFLLVFPWTISVGLACISLKVNQTSKRFRGHGFCTSVGCLRCSRNKQDLLQNFNTSFENTTSLQRIKEALQTPSDIDNGVLLKFNFSESRPIWSENQLNEEVRRDLARLREATQEIVVECNEALKHAYLWRKNEERNGSWYTFSLINQGVWQEEQCQVCPGIVTHLHAMTSIMTNCAFGNAFISLLPQNSQILEHRGITNARLRAHLGVEVPAQRDACYMKVDSEIFHWSVGGTTVFDDSYLHSVTARNCEEDRIILAVDFWHPDLSMEEKNCLSDMFPPVYT